MGEPDRSRVSGSEDYELDYVAQKHGNDRDTVEREAAKLSKS